MAKASQSILAGMAPWRALPQAVSAIWGQGADCFTPAEGHRSSHLYAHFVGSLSQNIPVFVLVRYALVFQSVLFCQCLIANAGLYSLMLLAVFMTLLFVQHQALLNGWLASNGFTNFLMGAGRSCVRQCYTASGNDTFTVAVSDLYYPVPIAALLLGMLVNALEGWMGVFVILYFRPACRCLHFWVWWQGPSFLWFVVGLQHRPAHHAGGTHDFAYTINLVIPSLLGGLVLMGYKHSKQISND